MKKIIVLFLVVTMCLSLAACGTKSEFKKVYNKAFDIVGMSRGKVDEGYFILDTNLLNSDNYPSDPYDKQKVSDTLMAIQYTNEALGFSPSLYSEMINTTKEMGTQSEENDKYKVTWSFDPHDGLEVTYEIKK